MIRYLPAFIVVSILTLNLTSGSLLAQGRGRGNHFGGRGQAGPPPQQRPVIVGRGQAAGVGPQFIFRPQVQHMNRQVLRAAPGFGVVQPFGFNYSNGWVPPVYAAPAYVPPIYSTPVYASPAYVQPAPGQNELDLAYQVQQLSREIEQLRQQQALTVTLPPPAPAPPPPSEPGVPQPLTTLVFRDGHQLNIENYAIVGQTLWILDEQASTRIPLSELDLPATQQQNRAQGVRFPLPR